MTETKLKVVQNKTKNLNELELEIEAPKEISSKAYFLACRNISNETDIPGFRKGKAPKDVIEKTFGQNFISQKAFENIFFDVLIDAAKQEKLDIIDVVSVSSFELKPEKPLVIKILVELKPEVKVGKYKNLKVKVKKMQYDKAAFIEKTLQKIASNLVVFKKVNNRNVKEGDCVTLDFEGHFEDGSEVPGGKAENFQAILEKDKFLPEFVDKLVGTKIGEKKEVVVTFPLNSDKGFAGKKGIFKVKINNIEEKEMPDINDSLAKKIGLEDLSSLEKKIVEEMESLQDSNNKLEFENKLVDEIIKTSKCVMSERMINKEIDFLLADLKTETEKKGIHWHDFKDDSKNKELFDKARESAVKRISIDLVLNTLIKEENITTAADEVDKEIQIRIAQAGEKFTHLKNDNRFRNAVRLNIVRNKILDFLVSNNEPDWDKEVTVVGPEGI